MKENEIIDLLNINWNEEGFFEKLRYPNEIDLEQAENILKSLKSFSLDDKDNFINKELVRLLWYIPQFMDWQKERLSEKNSDDIMKSYLAISGQISSEIERILGYP